MRGAILHRNLHHDAGKMHGARQYALSRKYDTDYHAFQTAESHDKLNLRKKDIMRAVTDEDSRNKIILMRNGAEHTLRKYTMIELHEILPHLLQPNQSELVSMEIIAAKGHDHIYLTLLDKNEKQKMVTIGRAYMKSFNLQYDRM